MTKRRELKRQSVFSVRITNSVDDGFLKWLNQLHDQGLLQRHAVEGLYVQYAQKLQIPGRWVSTPTETMMSLPRELLGYVLQRQLDEDEVLPQRTEAIKRESFRLEPQENVLSAPVVVTSQDEHKAFEGGTTEPADGENAALRSAFSFLNDD